ncbi:MAG: hypothetical protein ACJ74Z_12455 [Bryobacteraceae bacterium]
MPRARRLPFCFRGISSQYSVDVTIKGSEVGTATYIALFEQPGIGSLLYVSHGSRVTLKGTGPDNYTADCLPVRKRGINSVVF